MGKDKQSKADPNVVKWILDALAKIKRDKQNPAADNIIDTIKSTHSMSSELIEEQLNLAVNQGVIEKKITKGTCTFRVAVKSSPRKRVFSESTNDFGSDCLTIKKDTDLMPIVTAAIGGLDEKSGSTLKSIERFITRNYSIECGDGIELGAQLRCTTKKAVSRGQLLHEGRFYSLCTENGITDVEMSARKCTTKNASTAKKPTTNGPSTNHVISDAQGEDWQYEVLVCENDKSKKKKVAAPLPLCSFCTGTREKNRNGEKEELISCADCGNSGHPTCLTFSDMLRERVKRMRWQCIDCKTCSLCRQSGREVRQPVG